MLNHAKISTALSSDRNINCSRDISISFFFLVWSSPKEEVLKMIQTVREGNHSLTAGNNFLRQSADAASTERNFEKLLFGQHGGRISYVTEVCFTFHVEH